MDNGGPAFPPNGKGMTLRDWFAGMALTALGDDDMMVAINTVSKEEGIPYAEGVAIAVYSIADAMLEARK